jgi:hypothetical protein
MLSIKVVGVLVVADQLVAVIVLFQMPVVLPPPVHLWHPVAIEDVVIGVVVDVVLLAVHLRHPFVDVLEMHVVEKMLTVTWFVTVAVVVTVTVEVCHEVMSLHDEVGGGWAAPQPSAVSVIGKHLDCPKSGCT